MNKLDIILTLDHYTTFFNLNLNNNLTFEYVLKPKLKLWLETNNIDYKLKVTNDSDLDKILQGYKVEICFSNVENAVAFKLACL